MKLWTKLLKGEKITTSVLSEVGAVDSEKLLDYLTEICHGLDIPRPIVTPKHFKEFKNFNHTIFKPDDFVESVDFDKLWIEIAQTKNKKSDNFYSNL